MVKITFMGAGSTVFARNVLGDCMCTPALCDAEIALYDIDGERLNDSYVILSAINKNVNQGRASIHTYLGVPNRKDALRDADFVVNAIQVGGYDPCTITDFEIPKKYGLNQTIADTLGIGGIMRALRTIPVLEDFARDMEEVCPDAYFLNYTNPIQISEIAGYVGIDRTYLYRIFMHQAGVSPKQYLSRYRLEEAKEMLVQTEYRITEIAYSCGYHDSSSFCRHFQKATGNAPARYRSMKKIKPGRESEEKIIDNRGQLMVN